MKGLSIAYVKSVIEKAMSGRITKAKAAALLKVSERTVARLRKRQEADKDNRVVHGTTGRKSPRKTPEEVAGRIEELYAGNHSGFGFSHFRDMLEEREKMSLPLSTAVAVLKSRCRWMRPSMTYSRSPEITSSMPFTESSVMQRG